jgi:hypothetical protein
MKLEVLVVNVLILEKQAITVLHDFGGFLSSPEFSSDGIIVTITLLIQYLNFNY